jgi:uncharacterized coiled-coil protein SlyX
MSESSQSGVEEALAHRVVELEVRIAYQERLISDLDGVIQDFCRRFESLQREFREVQQNLDSHPVGPADEKPPHY